MRNQAKNKQKIEPAVFECSYCRCPIYNGKSDKRFKELKEKYPKLKKGLNMDHENPVMDVSAPDFDWNLYIEGLFCPVENWKTTCLPCHDIKTKREDQQRRTNKARKKS